MQFFLGGRGGEEAGLHPNDAVMGLEFDSWHPSAKVNKTGY